MDVAYSIPRLVRRQRDAGSPGRRIERQAQEVVLEGDKAVSLRHRTVAVRNIGRKRLDGNAVEFRRAVRRKPTVENDPGNGTRRDEHARDLLPVLSAGIQQLRRRQPLHRPVGILDLELHAELAGIRRHSRTESHASRAHGIGDCRGLALIEPEGVMAQRLLVLPHSEAGLERQTMRRSRRLKGDARQEQYGRDNSHYWLYFTESYAS